MYRKKEYTMKHPLAQFGYYGDAADYSSRGIENASADFSMRTEIDADEDFGKNCELGDFGTFGAEGCYGSGFEGFGGNHYGHFDHFLGNYDQGLGFKIKKPKFKAPKIVSKAISTVTKPVAAVTAPVLKPIASVAAPVLKPIASVAAPVLTPVAPALAPILAVSAPVMAPLLPALAPAGKIDSPSKVKDTLKKIKKPLSSSSTMIPKGVKKLAKKAEELVKNKVVPAAAIATGISVLKPTKGPDYVEKSDTISPVVDQGEVLTPQEAFEQKSEDKKPTVIIANSTSAHPLLLLHRRFKGETMSGFLDDLYNKQKKIVQKTIDANKDKAIKAATAQATNIVGKQLDKLSKTNPKAQQAITQVVASATETATSKAKEGIAETIKSSFEQNKKYIILAGGGLIALVALKMFMGRKA
jgi:ElaB/YqjD/DUF883 family membrane-anchored ribosome-binding protein